MVDNTQDNGGQSPLKTIPETAAYMGKSERTIRRYIASGKLPTVDIGGQTYIQAEAFDTMSNVSGSDGKMSAETDIMTGTVSKLWERIEDTLKDTIRRQESEIQHLRQEVTAKQTTIDNLTRMLPAPKQNDNVTGIVSKRVIWPYIVAGVAILAVIGTAIYIIFS